MANLTKYSVPMLYTRNKNTHYKQSVIARATALLTFMKQHDLISENPLNENGSLKLDFIVRESDLSPDGAELFKKAVPAWLRSLDKGRDPADTSSLMKELSKIRRN